MRCLLYFLSYAVASMHAWTLCSLDDGGGTCPTGNRCCRTGTAGVSSCITVPAHSYNGTGVCCAVDGSTGCGPGYECATTVTEVGNGTAATYCRLVEPPTDEPAPAVLPLYQLCQLPPESLQLHALTVQGESDPKLAYHSSIGSLTNVSMRRHFEQVTQVIIVVHGSGRTDEDYLCCGISSVPQAQRDNSMVISPWFLSPDDDAPAELADSLLRWNESGPIPHTWRYGAEANNANVSSYEAMDRLAEAVMSDKEAFPNLQRIIVAGHSAGGQFTHRWALTSNAPTIWGVHERGNGAELRVVAANPRSFCYLDERRVTNGTLAKPDAARIEKCPGYNEWEWGLEMGGRVPIPKFVKAQIKERGTAAMIGRYSKRNVVYLAGKLDVLPVHSECEDDDFQGEYRLQRSERYYQSLQEVYGHRTHHRLVAEGVPHDHCLLFQSAAGQQALFGYYAELSAIDETSAFTA